MASFFAVLLVEMGDLDRFLGSGVLALAFASVCGTFCLLSLGVSKRRAARLTNGSGSKLRTELLDNERRFFGFSAGDNAVLRELSEESLRRK